MTDHKLLYILALVTFFNSFGIIFLFKDVKCLFDLKDTLTDSVIYLMKHLKDLTKE